MLNIPLGAWVIIGIAAGWLLALTFWMFRVWRHYNKLVSGAKGTGLIKVLNHVLGRIDKANKSLEKLSKRTEKIEKESRKHIQTIKLMRYNPFKEVGGDQSFIITFLDEDQSGVVLSSLHSRDNTRWFAKEIIQGKGKEHKLSKEEKKVIHE